MGTWRLPKAGRLPRRALLFGALVLALAAVGSLEWVLPRVPLRAGMVSPYDVTAPRTVEYVDRERTERLREEAAAAVHPVYRLDPVATREAEQAVRTLTESILAIRARRPGDLELRTRLVGLGLGGDALRAAERLNRTTLLRVRDAALVALAGVMREGVQPEGLVAARMRVRDRIRALPLDPPSLALAQWLAERAVRPNLFVDTTQTRRQREAARASVEPVRERILKGEVIVRRGEVVRQDQMRRLVALGLVSQPVNWPRVAGTTLLMALLVAVGAGYLWRFQPEVWSDDRKLVLIALLALLGALGTRIVATRLSGFLVPVAGIAMLLSILLNPRLASFAGGALAILTGVVGGNDLRFGVVAYVGSLAGVYAIRRIRHRSDLAYAGLLVAGVNVLAVAAVDLIAGVPLMELVQDAGWGALNGVLSGVLAVGALPYLEDLFGLVTPIKLLELSDPSHPLLRRLQLEAPGTYHHTVMVANLAEAAAEAIGANALLVRVGTYYHDIGKLRRPAFFVENQLGARNPHDRLPPSLSALAIASHVREGLVLARQYRLPKAVADFIPEHHGTSLIRYFYHRAVERGGGPVEEETYRYEGPKPRSQETAIVMLADTVEAAVRALPNPTPNRIEEVVRRMIRERLEDGQLDECDLTFRDLERIAETFTRILVSMFHPRIEYPEVSLEAHRAQRRGGAGRAGQAPR
jgi:putative nucleotidyltransferase with HDIG domain